MITRIDGIPVAGSGTVPLQGGEEGQRVDIDWLFTRKDPGDTIAISVLRNGLAVELEVTAALPGMSLCQRGDLMLQRGRVPEMCCVYGGLVFCEVSLQTAIKFILDKKILDKTLLPPGSGDPDEGDGEDLEHVVLVVGVLPHPINMGYTMYDSTGAVRKVNGIKFEGGLLDLKVLLAQCQDGTVEIELDGKRLVMFDAVEAVQASAHVRLQYGVPSEVCVFGAPVPLPPFQMELPNLVDAMYN